jgi:hypothetical protein
MKLDMPTNLTPCRVEFPQLPFKSALAPKRLEMGALGRRVLLMVEHLLPFAQPI